MNVNEYQGKNCIASVDSGGKKYRAVYNNTGAAISNGVLYNLCEKWISGKGLVLVPVVPATNTELTNQLGICANNTSDGTIADGEYGWFLVEGPYGADADDYGATTSGSVAANAQLEVLNATAALIDSGAVGGAVLLGESCAIAIENVTTNRWAIYLLGKRSAIKAS